MASIFSLFVFLVGVLGFGLASASPVFAQQADYPLAFADDFNDYDDNDMGDWRVGDYPPYMPRIVDGEAWGRGRGYHQTKGAQMVHDLTLDGSDGFAIEVRARSGSSPPPTAASFLLITPDGWNYNFHIYGESGFHQIYMGAWSSSGEQVYRRGANWTLDAWHVYRFEQDGSGNWRVFVDGDLVWAFATAAVLNTFSEVKLSPASDMDAFDWVRVYGASDEQAPTVPWARVSSRHPAVDHYDLTAGAQVEDPQGLQTIVSVILQYPDGTEVLPLLDDGLSCDGAAGDGQYGWCGGDPFPVPNPAPLPLGVYRIVVTDADGNVTVAEDPVEHYLDQPANIWPAEGVVVGPPLEFSWDPVEHAEEYNVGVFSDEGEFWRVEVTSTSVPYNVDDLAPALESGRQYQWAIWAWDSYGNESSQFGTRFVYMENQAPTAHAGTDRTLTCVLGPISVLLDGTGSTDPDGDDLSYIWWENGTEVASGPTPTVGLSVGTHIVTLSVDDGNGGTDTDEVIVTLLADTERPVIALNLGDSNVECGSAYADAGATATDNCDGDLTEAIETSNLVDPDTPGGYQVVYSVSDAAGNPATATRDIDVEDTLPPDLIAEASPTFLWPPNNKMVDVGVTLTASDACDPDPTIKLVSASGNDGARPSDIDADIGTADVTVALRAKRRGKGDGRTYTLEYEVEDASGNTATATTDVTVEHDQGAPKAARASLPAATVLHGAGPNPFNPSTTIRYDLMEGGPVTLRVYDVTGRLVREVISGVQPAGSHAVVWDGQDAAGTQVSSGVYLSELRAGGFRGIERMLLLK